MIIKPFGATFRAVLEADSGYLPLSNDDNTKLLGLLPEGEEMLLTIQDNLYHEWVKAENQCGTIIITRGIDGSEPRKFPKGSCIFFETSVPVIKWLICNHNCCDGPCPCEPVDYAGAVIPAGVVGQPWEGSVLFTGDTPMTFGVDNLPSWMTATNGANYVRLSGTPVAAGTFSLSVAAGNCDGAAVATHSIVVTIT